MSTQPYPVRMVRTYGKLLAPRVNDVEMTSVEQMLCCVSLWVWVVLLTTIIHTTWMI